jgi:hypothetical protein
VIVAEGLAVAVGLQPLAQPRAGALALQQFRRLAVETEQSRTMPRKRGETRLRRWQNSASSEVALYSSPLRPLCTEKLIVVGWVATSRAWNSRVSSG